MSGRQHQFRSLERRIRLRIDARIAGRRLVGSLPAIAQIVAAVTASYGIAHYLAGHASPLLAVTIVISSLGFTRDARPRRVLDSVVGILIGIAFSETLHQLVGSGLWQIMVVLSATLLVARLASPSPAFAAAAAVQAMMVMVMPVPAGGVYTRSIDGVIGGLVALLATALIPRDPRRLALKDATAMHSTLIESLGAVADALRHGDEAAAGLALERLRRTQALLDDWTLSLESAVSIARISPFLRRHLPVLRHQETLLRTADLTARHARVFARRVLHLVRDGRGREPLAALVEEISAAVGLLADSAERPDRVDETRRILAGLAGRLDPARVVPGAPVTESVLVLLLRPLVVDLLVGAGMPADDARTLLPPL